MQWYVPMPVNPTWVATSAWRPLPTQGQAKISRSPDRACPGPGQQRAHGSHMALQCIAGMHVHHASEGEVTIRRSLRDVAVAFRAPDPARTPPRTQWDTHAHTVPKRHVVWPITWCASICRGGANVGDLGGTTSESNAHALGQCNLREQCPPPLLPMGNEAQKPLPNNFWRLSGAKTCPKAAQT